MIITVSDDKKHWKSNSSVPPGGRWIFPLPGGIFIPPGGGKIPPPPGGPFAGGKNFGSLESLINASPTYPMTLGNWNDLALKARLIGFNCLLSA